MDKIKMKIILVEWWKCTNTISYQNRNWFNHSSTIESISQYLRIGKGICIRKPNTRITIKPKLFQFNSNKVWNNSHSIFFFFSLSIFLPFSHSQNEERYLPLMLSHEQFHRIWNALNLPNKIANYDVIFVAIHQLPIPIDMKLLFQFNNYNKNDYNH